MISYLLIAFWATCSIFMYGVCLGDLGSYDPRREIVDYAIALCVASCGPVILLYSFILIHKNFMNGFNHWRLW